MHNRGLQISLPLLHTRLGYIHQAVLNCRTVDDPARVFLLNLYHVKGNEYCVMDGHQPRCIDVDWWGVPTANRIDTLENQLIIIHRDWEEFCKDNTTMWEMILRLEDSAYSSKDHGRLAVHSLHPACAWSSRRNYQGPVAPSSTFFDGAAAVCLSYGGLTISEQLRYLLVTLTHQESRGKTHLCLSVAEGSLEDSDALERICVRGDALQEAWRNHQYVQGYSPLKVTLSVDGATSFQIAIQEVEIMEDAIWELKVSRIATDCSQVSHGLPLAHPAIWQEVAAPLSQLDIVPFDYSWMKCELSPLSVSKLY